MSIFRPSWSFDNSSFRFFELKLCGKEGNKSRRNYLSASTGGSLLFSALSLSHFVLTSVNLSIRNSSNVSIREIFDSKDSSFLFWLSTINSHLGAPNLKEKILSKARSRSSIALRAVSMFWKKIGNWVVRFKRLWALWTSFSSKGPCRARKKRKGMAAIVIHMVSLLICYYCYLEALKVKSKAAHSKIL